MAQIQQVTVAESTIYIIYYIIYVIYNIYSLLKSLFENAVLNILCLKSLLCYLVRFFI